MPQCQTQSISRHVMLQRCRCAARSSQPHSVPTPTWHMTCMLCSTAPLQESRDPGDMQLPLHTGAVIMDAAAVHGADASHACAAAGAGGRCAALDCCQLMCCGRACLTIAALAAWYQSHASSCCRLTSCPVLLHPVEPLCLATSPQPLILSTTQQQHPHAGMPAIAPWPCKPSASTLPLQPVRSMGL